MEKNGEGVRKGAWTKDEDDLLKNCVEMYGEGKWHLVPPRTGLNRCRKSCRLRWLNYLRPNLKRGCFMEDEVDLIQRLHKLLGNRWSLIAGRLPGRTANDVKNFWNTHIVNKSVVSTESCRRKTTQETIRRSNIIKPRPRTLTVSQRPMCPSDQVAKTNEQNDEYDHENPNKKQASSSVSLSQEEPNDWKNGISEFCSNNEHLMPSPSLLQEEVDKCIHWWSSLLEVNENGDEITPLPFSDNDFSGFGNNGFDLDGFTSSFSVDADVCKHVSYQQFQ